MEHNFYVQNVYLFTRYDIMLSCWNEDPTDRPSFQDICTKLESMLEDESVIILAVMPKEQLRKRNIFQEGQIYFPRFFTGVKYAFFGRNFHFDHFITFPL